MESQLLYRLRYRLQCSKVLFEGRITGYIREVAALLSGHRKQFSLHCMWITDKSCSSHNIMSFALAQMKPLPSPPAVKAEPFPVSCILTICY